MKLDADQFLTLCNTLNEQGESDENPAIHDSLHSAAEDAVSELLEEHGIDFVDLDSDQLEALQIAYKDGFWEPCHAEERERGRKALNVLGRLHDGLSDIIESGRIREADIPDDYQWLVSLLVNDSLPLFADGERVKVADVSGAAVPVVVNAEAPLPWRKGERLVSTADIVGIYDASGGVVAKEVYGPVADHIIACVKHPESSLAALREVLPYVPGYAEKDTAGRPWLANALAVVGEAPPVVESAADMIQRVFAKVNQETETWRGPDYIGSDLAYLAWAIAEGPGKGAVEWDEYNAAFVRFREWFAPEDPVWQFIKKA